MLRLLCPTPTQVQPKTALGPPPVAEPVATPVVRLEHVRVVRNGRALLDDVSWEVGAGQRWALLGPNG